MIEDPARSVPILYLNHDVSRTAAGALRKKGYEITTQLERHGNSLIGRYVLVKEPIAKDPREGGDGGG